ncbi:hypothetical protein GCM10022419_058880 [Nonomuraea rosea]|uniref:Uncharacterized protein n=1 Tax=Nonomuraea rosea TaxID=638574 RepID=A0ABP6XUH0_9ACTN
MPTNDWNQPWTSFQNEACEIDLLVRVIGAIASGPTMAYPATTTARAHAAMSARRAGLLRSSQAGPRATRPAFTLMATPSPSRTPAPAGRLLARSAATMQAMARVSTCRPATRW